MTNHPYTQDPDLQSKVKKMADKLFSAGFRAGESEIYAAIFPPKPPDVTTLDIMPKSIAHKPKRWAHKLNRK